MRFNSDVGLWDKVWATDLFGFIVVTSFFSIHCARKTPSFKLAINAQTNQFGSVLMVRDTSLGWGFSFSNFRGSNDFSCNYVGISYKFTWTKGRLASFQAGKGIELGGYGGYASWF